MKRFLLLLTNEFKFARTSIAVHIVAIIQPTIMYLLMTVILVNPTFTMNVAQPTSQVGQELVYAMEAVGSPIGEPYVDVHLIKDIDEIQGARQVVSVEERDDVLTAVQTYGLIDSNIVKNFRNRLTAAAIRLWNNDLGERAVTIEEHPWLPRDVPYTVYFGMALLPMATAMAASVVGGILTAREFEGSTIQQYRLSPTSPVLILGARFVRLVLTGYLGAGALLIAVGVVNAYWPATLWKVALILLPMGVITGGVGIIAGLLLQKTIPTFLISLVTSFVSWLMGSAFGLAAGFGAGYALASWFMPNTYAVELLFPMYFGASVGNPGFAILALSLMSLVTVTITALVYRQRILKQR